MTKRPPALDALRKFATRHGTILVIGLLVILVPVAVTLKSVEHMQKTVHGVVTKAAPGVEAIGGISTTLWILAALLVVCWFLGLLVTRTDVGQQWFTWEKAKFFTRSPLLQQEKQRRSKKEAQKGAAAPPAPARPALAHVAGGWQPGVVVEEQAGGWASVFVPDLPSIATGRLYCVHQDQILRLDLTLDAFRTKLTTKGHGSGDWLRALSDANLDAGGTTPRPPPRSATDTGTEAAPFGDSPA